MNILLGITNVNGFHEVPYSFGLASVAAYAQSKGHNVMIVDICAEEEYPKLTDAVRSFKPRVVGFSSVSSQFHHVKKCAKSVKELDKNIIVVAGGVHPTLYPAALGESDDIDALFVGESELSFGEFLEKVEKGQDYTNVDNLAYKKDGAVIVNPLKPLIQNLEVLPHPIKDALFERYIKVTGAAPFFFARGCPFLCTYCSNHALAKVYGMVSNKPRFKAVDACIDEIKQADAAYPFNTISITDDTFGLDVRWRDEFLEKYKQEIGKRFFCLLRVNVIDEDFIKKLRGAGCFKLQFGVESGNDYVRNTIMNRNITEKQITDAFDLCKKYKMETTAINIIGVPGETEEMIKDTVRLNRRLNPTDSGVNIFYPYKGTVLGDYCFSNKLVDVEAYNSFSSERRSSVLRYPPEHNKMLLRYHKNWQVLVYPYDMRRRLSTVLHDYPRVYDFLRKARRSLAISKTK